MLNRQLALVLAAIFVGGTVASQIVPGAIGIGAGATSTAAASVAASSSLGTTAVVGAGTGGTAAIGTTTIAAAASAALVLAVGGGILLTGTLTPEPLAAPPPITTSGSAERQTDAQPVTRPPKTPAITQPTEVSTPTDQPTSSETVRGPAYDPWYDQFDWSLPVLTAVPPTAPYEVVAGFDCFTPSTSHHSFTLSGRASLPGTIEVMSATSQGTLHFETTAGSDSRWVTAPLPGLLEFVQGSSKVSVRIVAGDHIGIWEPVWVQPCESTTAGSTSESTPDSTAGSVVDDSAHDTEIAPVPTEDPTETRGDSAASSESDQTSH